MKYLDVFTDMTHEHSESSMKQPIVTVHTLLNILLLLVFSALPGLSIANKPANITPAEMALLPSYCRDTQGFGYGDAYYNTSPNAPKWVAMMGKDFWHMHHYCWALINIRRSERASLSENEKLALRKSALGDFWYVVRNVRQDFVLLPEIYTWIGRTEILLRNPRAAAEAFSRARALKPDYTPAYLHWADFLFSQGNRTDAMQVVMDGLQHAPESKGLLNLYLKLGGKPENLPKREPLTDNPSPTAPQTDVAPTQESPAITAPAQQGSQN